MRLLPRNVIQIGGGFDGKKYTPFFERMAYTFRNLFSRGGLPIVLLTSPAAFNTCPWATVYLHHGNDAYAALLL